MIAHSHGRRAPTSSPDSATAAGSTTISRASSQTRTANLVLVALRPERLQALQRLVRASRGRRAARAARREPRPVRHRPRTRVPDGRRRVLHRRPERLRRRDWSSPARHGALSRARRGLLDHGRLRLRARAGRDERPSPRRYDSPTSGCTTNKQGARALRRRPVERSAPSSARRAPPASSATTPRVSRSSQSRSPVKPRARERRGRARHAWPARCTRSGRWRFPTRSSRSPGRSRTTSGRSSAGTR